MSKISVRNGVFETNSSSTHSLTMCSANDYNRWQDGELYLSKNSGFGYIGKINFKNKQFLTKEEAIELLTNNEYSPDENLLDMKKEDLENFLRDNEIYTYDNYSDDDLEWFEDSYMTTGGEKIIAFGQFGYDG